MDEYYHLSNHPEFVLYLYYINKIIIFLTDLCKLDYTNKYTYTYYLFFIFFIFSFIFNFQL